MMFQGPAVLSISDGRFYIVRLLGTGAANPTVEVGQGITVTRTGAGVYHIVFGENPGIFMGMMPTIGAVTPSDVKGFSFIRDTYDPTTLSIDIAIFNASTTATDLAASQFLDLWILFAASSGGVK